MRSHTAVKLGHACDMRGKERHRRLERFSWDHEQIGVQQERTRLMGDEAGVDAAL